jgi:hypothetical protein
MVSLPFVVQPKRKPITERIGSEDSGVIEVIRKGYLTSGEKAFVQQVQQYDNGTSDIVTLSRRIARKYGLTMDRGYGMVLAIISGDSVSDEEDSNRIQEIELEFADELNGVIKGLSATQVREELVMAACLLKYRVDPEFDIESISGIHPDLISGLAKLYREEERRSIEAFKEMIDEDGGVPTIEETEKKHSKGFRSRLESTTTD